MTHLKLASTLLALLLTSACTGSLSMASAPASGPQTGTLVAPAASAPAAPAPSEAASASSAAAPAPTPTPAPGQAANVAIANKIVSLVRVVPESYVMNVGEAKDLLATVQFTDGTFDSNVTWSSSDSRILDVNPATGKISAKAEGIASIIVAAMTDPSKRSLVTVTVRKGLVQEAVTRVEPASVTLAVGDTRQLKASVQLTDGSLSPNVVWESSNQNIAMVSGTGLVTAVGKGRATITAKAAGDSTRSATCDVTVE